MNGRCDREMDFGAAIERGRVTEITEAGAVVEDLDRPGIVTPPLQCLSGREISAGDLVYFFLFSDGDGAVL